MYTMRNFKIILQYDGGAYHGWQIQKNGVTVQETVQNAVRAVTGENITLKGAGRTDAGVHALRYPASFRSQTRIPCGRLPYAINSKLPPDIVCLFAEEMPPEFDASKNAKGKTYIYKILNSDLPDAFLRRYAWQVRGRLDVEKMRSAAKAFTGEHDFAGFCSAGFTVKTTVRTIYALNVEKDGDIITVSVTGNGFLYNMVRIIAGTLVFAGQGRLCPDDMADIIASRDRTRAGITAPPQGLFLAEVFY